jgi:hypothetical protein
MVVLLLYVFGLVATIATLAVAVLTGIPAINEFITAVTAASPNYVDAVVTLARRFEWALFPFVGGLVLMALARIVGLLASIDRALRGNP